MKSFKGYLTEFAMQSTSDYVFDGSNGPYSETDHTFPVYYYGKTKLEAENILLSSNKKFIIIRISTLYSNYSNNFYQWIVTNLKNNNVYIATYNVVDNSDKAIIVLLFKILLQTSPFLLSRIL